MTRLAVIAALLGISLPAVADVPPPYAYHPLSDDDRAVLAHGEITDGETTGGGVAAIFLGFGIGQAIQGRWLERGWMFTAADTVGGVMEVAGALTVFSRDCDRHCQHQGLALLGGAVVIEAASRILQTWDAFTAPAAHNRRLHELRARTVVPYVTTSGIGLGVQM